MRIVPQLGRTSPFIGCSQFAPKTTTRKSAAGTRKPAGRGARSAPAPRKAKARSLPGPSKMFDIKRGGDITLMQTLNGGALVSTPLDGEFYLNTQIAPSMFSTQMATIGAFYNTVELLELTVHWTKVSDIAARGQIAMCFDPAYDATATSSIDQVMRHPNAWMGMTWSDKALKLTWPPGFVRGPVSTAATTFFPAANMGLRVCVSGANGVQTVGRLWATAKVRFYGQK